MKMKGQVAIVTGGGGAIGGAICAAFAKEGAALAVFDLKFETAERVARKLRDAGAEAKAFALDVGDYSAVEKSVEAVFSEFGRIDVLVNCAGGSARGKVAEFHKQSIDVIHWMLNVNLFGALHCIRAVSPHMVEAKRGAIVNVTSIIARGGKAAAAEYGAAKGGVIAATKSLAIELGPRNITVNCVSPGKVLREEEKVEDKSAFAKRYSVVNRVCTQDDIARAVLFLALPESDFITGQDLAVDGGRSLGLRGDDWRE